VDNVGWSRRWLCRCECSGKEIVAYQGNLIKGHTMSCGCLNERRGEECPNFGGWKSISGQYWSNIKIRARNRNIKFDLDIKYAYDLLEKQNFKCYLSGLDISEGTLKSLDRIDSYDYYKNGNVAWTHKDINVMKWALPVSEFVNLCTLSYRKCSDVHHEIKLFDKNKNRWKGYGNISGCYWNGVLEGAKSRGLDVKIEIKDAWDLFLKQRGRCAITNMPIFFNEFSKDSSSHKTASLDRIDSGDVYRNGNVWWVHKNINKMKLNYDYNHFMMLCENVANFQNKFLTESEEENIWRIRG
jgi:hypothetical protein